MGEGGGEEGKSGICSCQTCGLGLSPEALVGGNRRDVNAARVFCPNTVLEYLCSARILCGCQAPRALLSLSSVHACHSPVAQYT